ncbi:MAG TPA: SAM-dependent methyltransferase [Frankiaceae bacterium]|nr:SAM-dependent methyltransferase [Frankiaceae bacterium]
MWRTWADAMAASLHGSNAYYPSARGPDVDFRTAATVAPDLLAEALVQLFRRLPDAAGAHVVEVGAGTGGLLAALAERLPPSARLIGVEQRSRPPGLPARVEWRPDLPSGIRGLLLAFEWLDTVPVDVVTADRVLEVDGTGAERTGGRPDPADVGWLDRWWPTGERREVGRRRDDAWTEAVGRLDTGVAVAVDYGHLLGTRPEQGSLTGYRYGRQVSPVPDADTDVTADLAWDAVAEAVRTRCPAVHRTTLVAQHEALRELGVSAELPSRAAPDQARALHRAGRARLLLDRGGLGGFGWLMSLVGVPVDVLPTVPTVPVTPSWGSLE